MWGIELSIMVAMVGVNAIFAAYEIALATVPAARLEALASARRWGAGAALRMKRELEASLAVVQLGITLVGAIAAATGGAGAEEQLAPRIEAWGCPPPLSDLLAIVLVVVPLTMFTIIVGELVPKLYALRHPEWICLRLSPVMSWMALSLWPVVRLLEVSATTATRLLERWWGRASTEESGGESTALQELRAWVAVARTSRLIGPREEGIIVNAARLSARPVREIVLPAEHISMLDVHSLAADCLAAPHLDMHTRFPVTQQQGDPQQIVGYVNFKDIVSHARAPGTDGTLRAIRRELPILTGELPLSQALEALIRHRTHMAIVRDAAERVIGLVTLEDIFEELVGDIQDEYDLLPVYAVPAGDGWIVGGGLSLAGLREAAGLDLTSAAVSGGARTIHGWVAGQLGRAPRAGDTLVHAGVQLVVRKVRRQQVLEAQVQRG